MILAKIKSMSSNRMNDSSIYKKMQVFVDLLNVKKITIEVAPLDRTENLKEKIAQITGLPVSDQVLSICQNGSIVELKNSSRIYLGDLVKSKTIINLSCKPNHSSTAFYIHVVTETGQVLHVRPEGGNSTKILNLIQQLSTRLSLPAERLFLRLVDMPRYVNKGLVPVFNTLEEFCVTSGAVIFVQIHPDRCNWFHGKITRDQAEQVMSSATDGQFLVKESNSYPGDYVLFVCANGKVIYYLVRCKENMMFTIDERQFCNSIDDLVKFYQNKRGSLPVKLTEPVSKQESTHCTNGISVDGSTTNAALPRARLRTSSSTEIKLQVVVGPKTFSLLTSPLNQIQSLKEQIEELSGVPTDCQFLRLNDKPLVMNNFILEDYHIRDNLTITVQVHPWSEEWFIGKLAQNEVESGVKGLNVANGMFLITESITSPGDYCLRVWWKGRPIPYRVECKHGRYRIDKSQQFSSLSSLVEYYMKHIGPLKTPLTEPVKFDKEQKGLIPPHVLARGTKAKAAYKRALSKGRTFDTRVRIMLIGENGAGKTSLKRSLKGEKFDKHEPSTQGVEMDAPLLKTGVEAWKEHQADETNTVFDHKSALLVARQLSVETPPQPSSPAFTANKSPRSSSVDCNENPFLFNPLVPGTNVSCNGGVSNGDVSPQRSKGLNGRRSPFLQDDVFSNDSELSDDLPQTIVSLVESILLQEHPPVNEEVWPAIWDFAGQFLFHAIHPIFMSQEAVYVLVFDLSKDLFKRTESCALRPGHPVQPGERCNMVCRSESSLDHLMKWMDLVHSFQSSQSVTSFGVSQPPVILVGTHADKVVDDPWTSMNAVLNSFQGKTFSSHIVDEKFVVDNTRSGQPFPQEDPNVKRLRQEIVSVASTLPHIKREIPLLWLQVEKELHRLSRKGVKHVTKAEFMDTANKICHFEVLGDGDELLHFLCDCGAVLCFNEASGSDSLVILDPQWLTIVFREIISLVHQKDEPMEIRQHRQSLAKKGILSEELVSFACQTLGLAISKESLLSFMEKCDLVCRWDVPNGKPVYFVPSMLTAQPEQEISGISACGSIAPVFVTFNTGYVPYGLFARFLVLFGQWASREHAAKPPRLFANVARFFMGEKSDFSLMFASFKTLIMIHLVYDGKEKSKETAAVCKQICSRIEEILCYLQKQCPWLHSMTWQLSARCDLCLGEREGPNGCSWHGVSSCVHPDCAHFIPLGPGPLRCVHTRKHNTRLDEDKLKPWIKHMSGNPYPDLLSYKPGLVSRDDLLLLARDLGLQWKQLCRILLGDAELVHIDHDQRTLYDKSFVTLSRWAESRGSQATYSVLGMALMHEDLQAEDLCKQYCLATKGILESSI